LGPVESTVTTTPPNSECKFDSWDIEHAQNAYNWTCLWPDMHQAAAHM